MDIYGYLGYPYNQSDELAKQMFAHQALASSIPYNRGIPEPHAMPAPTGTPWNIHGIPWSTSSPPQLVQFTGHQPVEPKITPVIHCKRKSLDVEPVIPAKQLITEEKMAAHLNSLHISPEYTSHSLATDEVMDVGMEPVSEKLKGHTIVLSEELKKLQEEPLLPAALIDRCFTAEGDLLKRFLNLPSPEWTDGLSLDWLRLEKPHMSLVVWKPRENLLEKLKEEDENKSEKEDNQNRRTPVLVPPQTNGDMEM